MHIAKTLRAWAKTKSQESDHNTDYTQVFIGGVNVDTTGTQRLGADRARPRTLPRVRCTDCVHHKQKRGQAYCTAAHMSMSDTDQERQCLYFEAQHA